MEDPNMNRAPAKRRFEYDDAPGALPCPKNPCHEPAPMRDRSMPVHGMFGRYYRFWIVTYVGNPSEDQFFKSGEVAALWLVRTVNHNQQYAVVPATIVVLEFHEIYRRVEVEDLLNSVEYPPNIIRMQTTCPTSQSAIIRFLKGNEMQCTGGS